MPDDPRLIAYNARIQAAIDMAQAIDTLGLTQEWALRFNDGTVTAPHVDDPDVAQVGIGDLRDKGLEPELVFRYVSVWVPDA